MSLTSTTGFGDVVLYQGDTGLAIFVFTRSICVCPCSGFGKFGPPAERCDFRHFIQQAVNRDWFCDFFSISSEQILPTAPVIRRIHENAFKKLNYENTHWLYLKLSNCALQKLKTKCLEFKSSFQASGLLCQHLSRW